MQYLATFTIASEDTVTTTTAATVLLQSRQHRSPRSKAWTLRKTSQDVDCAPNTPEIDEGVRSSLLLEMTLDRRCGVTAGRSCFANKP